MNEVGLGGPGQYDEWERGGRLVRCTYRKSSFLPRVNGALRMISIGAACVVVGIVAVIPVGLRAFNTLVFKKSVDEAQCTRLESSPKSKVVQALASPNANPNSEHHPTIH